MAAVEALSSAELSQAFFLRAEKSESKLEGGPFQVFDPGSMSLEQIRRFEICSHHQRQRGPLARCRLVGRRYGGLAYLP